MGRGRGVMRWSVRVPGTRVRLGATLLAVVAFSAGMAVRGLVVDDRAAGPGDEGLALVAAFVAMAVGSVVLHEAAHAVAARALGYRVEWVALGLFDGGTSYSGPADRPLDRAAIAMAGPAASAVGFLALLGVWAAGVAGPGGVVRTGLLVNVTACLLNLVPFAGSDGWCVAAGLLEDRHRARATHAPGPDADRPEVRT